MSSDFRNVTGPMDDRSRREEESETVDLAVTGSVAFGGVSVTD